MPGAVRVGDGEGVGRAEVERVDGDLGPRCDDGQLPALAVHG
ncbi:hypothetical protein [Streptomyces sp. NPDC056061]